jgi:hypothetical protein
MNKKKSQLENSLVIKTASKIKIEFPENKILEEHEQDKIKKSIKDRGIAHNNKTYVHSKSLPTQLNTDSTGAQIFYGKLDDKDKLTNGNDKYASTSSVLKEISERIEQPRNALVDEKLKFSEQCIKAFRDSPDLQRERQIEEVRIRQELPNLTRKKMKIDQITKCQFSGEDFDDDAEAHHKVRVADDPTKALDFDNLEVAKRKYHREAHSKKAETPEQLEAFKKEKGWNSK